MVDVLFDSQKYQSGILIGPEGQRLQAVKIAVLVVEIWYMPWGTPSRCLHDFTAQETLALAGSSKQ
jgi:hypothetical protein